MAYEVMKDTRGKWVVELSHKPEDRRSVFYSPDEARAEVRRRERLAGNRAVAVQGSLGIDPMSDSTYEGHK